MIEVRELRFAYGRGTPVIDRLTFGLQTGRMTAITGPSGCGKSTLLYLLGLLLRPSSGSIHLDGSAVSSLPDAQRSRLRGERIGFVFQDAALDPSRSILDNVVEGVAFTGSSRSWARAQALTLLDGMGVLVEPARKPGQISGGQAQRVALCRALLPSPAVILADEPTGNLDTASAGTVIDRLRQESRAGVLVAVATHDPRVLEACDDVLALA